MKLQLDWERWFACCQAYDHNQRLHTYTVQKQATANLQESEDTVVVVQALMAKRDQTSG